MDAPRGRPQHSHRSYKTIPYYSRYYDNINYNFPSSNGFLQTSGIQRQSLKWKKDYYYRRNHKSSPPCRRNNGGGRKSATNQENQTKKSNKSEDVEEEERKKKLTDTAKKLLSKIKTWSAGNTQGVSEHISDHNIENTYLGDKPKRIAHSKKANLVKKATQKCSNKPTKKKIKYDVNKETVKDFQNRIQHKLMEEIMQMPKENLQNVLNDPKINPIMELKMSRLVRENRVLIAHKLRAIAESKMKSDCPSNPQFLEDIDKLIDPVIESDLSVLPYELIKQMENIFQVQFDYSHGNETPAAEGGVCEIPVDEETSQLEKNVKVENNEDLSLYECSTDEDEEMSVRSLESNLESCLTGGEFFEPSETLETSTEIIPDPKIEINENKFVDEKSPENENPPPETPPFVPEEPIQNSFTSIGCQTECDFNSSSTQTDSNAVESLYGVPLPKEAVDDSISSLLEEVGSIQNLLNKLNERRMMIFLQLTRINPSGSYIQCNTTKTSLIETLSNGNLSLADALEQFFSNKNSGRR